MTEYGIIVVDPPWKKRKGGARRVRPNQKRNLDYETMRIDQIFELLDEQIFPLAKERHCAFVWVIEDYLIDLEKMMLERGYKRHARLIWDKGNGVAPSFTVRYSYEYLIWYYKQPMLEITSKYRGKFDTVMREPSREHSRKPNVAYYRIEKMYPAERKLDVFSREKKKGWDQFGDQVDYFGKVPKNGILGYV